MGTANSTPIPGGGTEGYHVLKVIILFLLVNNEHNLYMCIEYLNVYKKLKYRFKIIHQAKQLV